MSKHTPGPWSRDNIETKNQYVLSPNGYVVATINQTNAYQKSHAANADLIAAAPLMYDYINRQAKQGDKEALNIIKTLD